MGEKKFERQKRIIAKLRMIDDIFFQKIFEDLKASEEILRVCLEDPELEVLEVTPQKELKNLQGRSVRLDVYCRLGNGTYVNVEVQRADQDDHVRSCLLYTSLHFVNEALAKKIAGDGEGATALFEAKVVHADTLENARTLAKSVITSSLTKAAIFGHDANWGRILCALGYSGVQFDPEKIELYLESSVGKILIFKDGTAADYSEEEAGRILSSAEVTAFVDMKMGDAEATAWGCDLTYDYVKINADYRS